MKSGASAMQLTDRVATLRFLIFTDHRFRQSLPSSSNGVEANFIYATKSLAAEDVALMQHRITSVVSCGFISPIAVSWTNLQEVYRCGKCGHPRLSLKIVANFKLVIFWSYKYSYGALSTVCTPTPHPKLAMAQHSQTPQPQAIDPYVIQYNQSNHLTWQQELQRYREALQAQSLAAALGPPAQRPRIIQVPQLMYIAQRPFNPVAPVTFFIQAGNRMLKGINLAHALAGNFEGLYDPHRQLEQLSNRPRITCRLEVYGYQSFDSEMKAPSRNYVTAPTFPRQTIASRMAHAIRACMQRDGGHWAFANIGNVHFNDLWLLEIRHVSRGSWQPVLAFYRL
ncbi:hypothetical protein NM688_g2257 [Phlebia brevispora]|uniref:Uncharacterized protein n=1 Tax=Phlebia brevispora TaxID=194682 RepID=A0ACC1T9D3_9APHY|nr:hypothetical protein NM688_g2257 [Phlebia brevispora]